METLTTHADSRTKGLSSRTDTRAPLPRRTSSQLTDSREVVLVPAWSLHLYVVVLLAWEGTLQATRKRSPDTSPGRKSLSFNLPCLKDVLG